MRLLYCISNRVVILFNKSSKRDVTILLFVQLGDLELRDTI